MYLEVRITWWILVGLREIRQDITGPGSHTHVYLEILDYTLLMIWMMQYASWTILEYSYSLSINRAVFCSCIAFSICFVKHCIVYSCIILIAADSTMNCWLLKFWWPESITSVYVILVVLRSIVDWLMESNLTLIRIE